MQSKIILVWEDCKVGPYLGSMTSPVIDSGLDWKVPSRNFPSWQAFKTTWPLIVTANIIASSSSLNISCDSSYCCGSWVPQLGRIIKSLFYQGNFLALSNIMLWGRGFGVRSSLNLPRYLSKVPGIFNNKDLTSNCGSQPRAMPIIHCFPFLLVFSLSARKFLQAIFLIFYLKIFR